MNRTVIAVLSVFLSAAAGVAAEFAAAIDCGADVRLFDSHFGRHGYQPTRNIARDEKGIRIYLPALNQGVPQTGLYSFFSVAGDFEVSTAYEIVDMAPPASGYGKSCGIAVETPGPQDVVSVTRGCMVGKGNGYVVTRGHRADGPMTYESTHYPTAAKTGRLFLRRENADVICLAEDGPQGERRELMRLPFTPATISKVRLFADTGDSHGSVDVRFTQLQVRAVEIAGGEVKYQPPQPWGWRWWTGLGGLGVVTLGLATLRVRKGRWPWSRTDD